jgi:hypothetical protein
MMLAAGAYAQHEVRSVTFQPKLGMNIANFRENTGDPDPRFAFVAGGEFEYQVAPKLSFSAGLLYSQQGVTKEGWSGEKKTDTTIKTDYINIPVMFKYYIIPALSVDLGPQLGVNVYSKVTSKIKGSGSAESKNTTDNKDNTKTIDVGVGLGLTYNITKDVFIQGRYTLGLTKAFNYGDAYGLDYKNRKNGNAQIAIGYRF